MPALAAVARRDDRLVPLPPGGDHALDRFWSEVGPVGQHDHRCVDLGRELGQATAKRGAGATAPLGATNDGRVRLHFVRAEHDEHLVERGPMQPPEHLGQQQLLLRRAEARRGARGEDDGGDAQRQPRSVRQAWVTFATYSSVSEPGAPPERTTAAGPAL